MKNLFYKQRPAASLIELLVFVGIFALVSGVILTLFFSTTEQRARQQVIMNVEQSGLQLMEALSHRIRTAEIILDPPAGSSGFVLTLQVSSEELNPTLIASESGTLVAVQSTTKQVLSPPNVTISNFWVHNTSTATDEPGLYLTFHVSGTIPLPQPTTYKRQFETALTLYPDNVLTTHCGCASPSCVNGVYTWEVCQNSVCSPAGFTLNCADDDDDDQFPGDDEGGEDDEEDDEESDDDD